MSDNIEMLKGLTLVKVELQGWEELWFTSESGRVFKMFHYQDCCETVTLDDICGDLNSLVGEPILTAEMRTNQGCDGDGGERQANWYSNESSYTWTFYELATIKGSVTLRWYGTSNGYYSEEVDFEEVAT